MIFKFSSKKNLLINITCHKARVKTYKAQILTVVAEKLEPAILNATLSNNSYFYIEKWTFKGMCEVCYRAKRDKKEAT